MGVRFIFLAIMYARIEKCVIARPDPMPCGWSNYFHYGHGHRKMKQVKYYMEERLRLHLRNRHKVNNRGAAYYRFPRCYIYDHLGLYKVPIMPAWKGAHA